MALDSDTVKLCDAIMQKFISLWLKRLSNFQVNFDVTGATANSTVAIDELNVRVSSRTCGPNDPPCLVYEDHGVAGQNNQSQTGIFVKKKHS